ncbi:MAG: hypothetical protein H6677_14090 [Candidatus Obscuribacterales bacterium]|nr:hypothetical protein [Candidatus Obscuribacterales bacterium]
MKSGLILFILIMFGLGVATAILTTSVSSYLDRDLTPVSVTEPRRDLQGGKQVVIDPEIARYWTAPEASRPESRNRVTPEEYQNAWMNYWAKQEGHEPFAK